MSADSEVAIVASDGWPIGGLLSSPDTATTDAPGVVLVPASRHERDAYTAIAAALARAGRCLVADRRPRARGQPRRRCRTRG